MYALPLESIGSDFFSPERTVHIMGDKNPKKRPKQKKVVEKVCQADKNSMEPETSKKTKPHA